MARERLRKLAQRLNRPLEDLVELLEALGEKRYRRPDDIVPETTVREVEAHLKKRGPGPGTSARPAQAVSPSPPPRRPLPAPSLPRAFPDDPALNATLQDYLQAGSLAELKQRLPPTREPAARPTGLPPSPQVELDLRSSLGAEILRRRLLQESLEEIQSQLHEARAQQDAQRTSSARREAELANALEALHEQVGQLEQAHAREVEALKLERDQLLEELRRTRDALHAANRTRDQLEIELRDLRIRGAAASLDVRQRAEASSLASAATGTDASAAAESASPEEAGPGRGAGRDGRPGPPTAPAPAAPTPGRALFDVDVAASAPARTSRQEAVEHFIALCREREIERINVVGGSPAYGENLLQLLGGSLKIRWVDGTGQMDSRKARQQVEGTDLTLIWGGTQLKHRVSKCYTDLRDRRVVSVQHRGLEGMLRAASEILANDRRWAGDDEASD